MQAEDQERYDVGKVLKKMKLARDEVIDEERIDEETSVISIVHELQGTLRTLTNERENDRYTPNRTPIFLIFFFSNSRDFKYLHLLQDFPREEV